MGREKNPRGRRKKRKKAWAGRLGPGLKHHLSAIDHGAKLGAKIYGVELDVRIYGVKLGVELSAKSPSRLRRAQDLGATNDSAEQCKLGASDDGAELRIQIFKILSLGTYL